MPPVSGATLPIAIVRVVGACAFLSSPQPVNTTMAAITRTKWERIMAASGSGFRLLDRQNVFRQSLCIVVADGPVRRHRDGSPYAGRAFLDLLHEIGFGVLSGPVLDRHFLVRGADQFLVHRMAAQAGFVLQELLRVGGEQRAARECEDCGCG